MPDLKELLNVLQVNIGFTHFSELREAVDLIIHAQETKGGETDTITAAFRHGPLYDGDVPSKSARDSLTEDGFMCRVLVRGEEGYNACTYKGARLYRLLEVMHPNLARAGQAGM